MFPPRSLRRLVCWLVFGAGWLLAARDASAQQQERIDHILNPDRTMHAEGFGKTFVPTSASGTERKGFLTRFFGGSRTATLKAGDGSFHTSGFLSGRDGYATTDFTTRKLPQAGQTASVSDHTFGTKPLALHEDYPAGKAVPTNDYVRSDKPFLGRGKRQDDIDDLRRQKNLSIDQVREILNKQTSNKKE